MSIPYLLPISVAVAILMLLLIIGGLKNCKKPTDYILGRAFSLKREDFRGRGYIYIKSFQYILGAAILLAAIFSFFRSMM